jgi:hypothetical protein
VATDVPSCPRCERRDADVVWHNGRKYLCASPCETLYVGGPDEWEKMRSVREDWRRARSEQDRLDHPQLRLVPDPDDDEPAVVDVETGGRL